MIHVANPIYDIVFKYLMEDERIAKTILSALLKKEVLDVAFRKNEYSNTTRDTLSIFRLDFSATVREEDGSAKLILIELQKTWLETETLRFRQYLGAQYANPDNIQKESAKGYAIPMVTVYLLGHRVGNIEEPILYVRRKAYDYDDHEVTTGLPDPFVESLTHESIIVQIPRIRGQVNNRLEKVLSVFDQTRMDADHQILQIDESLYDDDEELQRILRRLVQAASDRSLRHDMNVEDEYFSAIERRDTEILVRDKMIAEQRTVLEEQRSTLEEQRNALEEERAKTSGLVKFMLSQGIPLSEIAKTLNISEDDIQV